MPDDFHEQTKFVDEPRKRHRLPWEDWELAVLKNLYMLGIPLREICDKMQRPKEGVLPKLVQLGLIRRVADGYRYVYRRKVLPDSYKVSDPNRDSLNESIDPNAYAEARNEEKRFKYTEACGGNPVRVSSAAEGMFATYPYLASAIDSIDAGIFKDAASGISTCADFSGLEMRAASASWCRSDTTTTGRITSPTPNHTFQTQPKEPIMKIETKVFINDQDASTYTDDQIFGEIRRAEKRIEELKAIKTPTKKLADNISKLEEYASKLAAYLDAR